MFMVHICHATLPNISDRCCTNIVTLCLHAVCRAAGTPASAVYSDAADTASTPMGQNATGNVLANANLPVGVTAQVTGFSVAGSTVVYPTGSSVTLNDPVTGQPIGTLTVLADGSYTFDPVDGYVGPAPAVNVYSKASNGQTAVSSLTLDVLPGGLGDWHDIAKCLAGNLLAHTLGADAVSPV